jgi:hypothetical protein
MSSPLEEEFKSLFNSIGKEIDNKIIQALQLIAEAENMSEKYGIPFKANLIQDYRSWYIPTTYKDRFNSLDQDFVYDMTLIDSYRLSKSNGWQHSQSC